MKIIGIDLSGPVNHKDTVLTVFQLHNDRLEFEGMIDGASDEMIISRIEEEALSDEVVIGIDAPLSYQDGGETDPKIKAFENLLKVTGCQVAPLCHRL